jgi:hypothetical protein
MSRHRITLIIEVDDTELADHDGKAKPPPNDVSEWDGSDVFAAENLGIINGSDTELVEYEKLGD